jgi:hypothetical protein
MLRVSMVRVSMVRVSMVRRLVLAGLAGLLAAPAFLIAPASAAIAFTCDSVTGSAVFSPGLVHDKRPHSLSSGPTAPAGPANITLASTSDAGVKGTPGSQQPSLSADGTRVAFISKAINLDPADTSNLWDVYVKDLSTGDIILASTSDTGVKGNGGDTPYPELLAPSLSGDGTRVAFASSATNLDPADTDTSYDIYVKNLLTGNIDLASTSDTGVKGNGDSYWPKLSGDGTRVAFGTYANNLDPAGADITYGDAYVKDLTTGDITIANSSDAGVRGNGSSRLPSLSADGTRVAFHSDSTNLDPADTDTNGDVYVKSLTTGDITLASTSAAGVKGNSGSAGAWLSADGTKVAFSSGASNFDPRGGGYFVKDLSTGDITLASTTDAGVTANYLSSDEKWLSGDGTRLAFHTSATNLDPADTEGREDVYVKNLVTGDLTLASTSDNGVKPYNLNSTTIGGSLSADGTKVAFFSAGTNLDPADTDDSYDIYVKNLPTTPTSIAIGGCSNGNSGTASIVDIRSYGPRPLGCPVALGGAEGNDYADTTPILVGAAMSMTIDWATGPNSYGVAAAKAGPTGTQWRFRLAITANPGHDTPATNQYLPAAESGFTKTRLQGRIDWSALDSFNCTTGVNDPLSWLSLANNGAWVAKTS